MTAAVQSNFSGGVSDKSHLAQLVQTGHNTVKKDMTAMEVDVSFDKQVRFVVFLYFIGVTYVAPFCRSFLKQGSVSLARKHK